MQSTSVNDVKIYNLTMGKSMPDWLSSRKRRRLLKTDSALRNRIELFQDFVMPGVSQCIKLSPDGQSIVVTGTYKPRMRSFDTHELAMKFERCFDYSVIKFDFLSEDWTKLLFLQDERWLEFHSQSGRYYRVRIPKIGHDMSYIKSKCEVYVAGVGSEINRFNLEIGKFNTPLESESLSLEACAVNPYHELFITGSKEGIVEAFDPRCDKRVGRLDIAFSTVTPDTQVDGLPSVSCISFKDSLHFAVGTSTGQILLYDLRSSKPLVVKDHFYGLPIKKTVFIPNCDLVVSLDEKIVKIWKEKDASPFTAIQTAFDLNDILVVPDTGMMMLANEDTKIQAFYIPSLGPAPKWASFLDRIVEEMEENTNEVTNNESGAPSFGPKESIYDDYKFVTEAQLQELGLDHLIGTNLLRAYLHGFFIDIRLYNKAKSLAEPFKYEEYKKKKIEEKLEASRSDRVVVKSKLPTVNRDLAAQLMMKQGVDVIEDEDSEEDGEGRNNFDVSEMIRSVKIKPHVTSQEDDDQDEEEPTPSKSKKVKKTKKAKGAKSILQDQRFKALFLDKNFEVDVNSEEYQRRIANSTAAAVARAKKGNRRKK